MSLLKLTLQSPAAKVRFNKPIPPVAMMIRAGDENTVVVSMYYMYTIVPYVAVGPSIPTIRQSRDAHSLPQQHRRLKARGSCLRLHRLLLLQPFAISRSASKSPASLTPRSLTTHTLFRKNKNALLELNNRSRPGAGCSSYPANCRSDDCSIVPCSIHLLHWRTA